MESENLQKQDVYLFSPDFIDPIDPDDQKIYDEAFEDLRGKITIKKSIFIQKENFVNVVLQAKNIGAKYLKLHFIQESSTADLNIGFSFCKDGVEEDGTVLNDLDSFYIVRKDLLVDINKDIFGVYKDFFKNNLLVDIQKHTNKEKNTQHIKYNMEKVLLYNDSHLISDTFNATGIMINLIIFKNYKEANMNDRVAISIHTILIDSITQKSIPHIGYDFGSVYP